MKGFKNWLMRGNVVDLAIAVVIGAAFGAVITSFVKNLLTPLIAIPGKAQFNDYTFTVRNSVFRYGTFLTDVITFLIIAAAVFFLVVWPLMKLSERRTRLQEAEHKDCTECLSQIPVGARKCAFCGSGQEVVLPAQTPGEAATRVDTGR